MTRRRLPATVLALVLPVLAACGPSSTAEVAATAPATTAAGGGGPATRTVDLDGRPFQLHIPASYRAGTRAPLVVLLHGYTASGALQETYFKLTAESDRRGFLYAMPDGTPNAQGKRFWNASRACCNFNGSAVDDVAYLHRLIGAVRAAYAVDPARVYLVGHSNGGFMAYRMACEHAEEITAIVSLAGAATTEPPRCAPARPVSVLQIHGTADRTIPYAGGAIGRVRFPSVAATLATWRRLDGCADRAGGSGRLDLDPRLSGRETTVTTYSSGCRGGSRVELWSIKGGGHIPALGPAFARQVLDFLYARGS